MLTRVNEPVTRKLEGIRIADASFPSPYASGLEYANEVLDQKTEELGSVQSIQDLAKEELGLVDPDTILIDLD